jgi:hypothetical protein
MANRALQKLGAKRIVSLSDDTVAARACNVAFEPVKLALLRKHIWSFSIKRASLAADATAPDWGKAYSYTLPSDWIKMADDYPEDNFNTKDWEIEGRKIFTDDAAPLYIRYIYNVTDPNEMDALFRELFSTELALELCEELTQSNTKKAALETDAEKILRESRKANAIEKISAQPPEDTWLTVRA